MEVLCWKKGLPWKLHLLHCYVMMLINIAMNKKPTSSVTLAFGTAVFLLLVVAEKPLVNEGLNPGCPKRKKPGHHEPPPALIGSNEAGNLPAAGRDFVTQNAEDNQISFVTVCPPRVFCGGP
ncbi:MAG: hypothetical protein V1799_04535 [bacterium]